MKFAHSIKQKTKVAVLLFCIMSCTILVRIFEDKSIKEMGNSFASLYNDRLIPATDLFFIAEKLYAKKSIIEAFLNTDSAFLNKNAVAHKINLHDKSIDSLLNKYEKTFLVTIEKKQLNALKNNILATRLVEKEIISANSDGSGTASLSNAYKQIFSKLAELTQLQSKVGEEIIKDSKELVSGSNVYSTIQFVLAIIIGILIVSIMFTSNVINIKNDKFNLN